MIELPPVILRKRYESDEAYIEAAYKVFLHDMIDYPPTLKNEVLYCMKEMMPNGFHKTFWHIITEGDHLETDRVVGDRVEKIPWINPIISGQPDPPDWMMWEKPAKRNNKRILIYSTKYNYLVVIEKRERSGIVFWTAYPVDTPHRVRKLRNEYLLYSSLERSEKSR